MTVASSVDLPALCTVVEISMNMSHGEGNQFLLNPGPCGDGNGEILLHDVRVIACAGFYVRGPV